MVRSSREGAFSAWLALSLSACGVLGSEDSVRLQTNRAAYGVHDTIELAIHNGTGRQVAYTGRFCPGAATEIWRNERWNLVPNPIEGIPCFGALPLPRLEANETVVEEYFVEGWLDPGRYRFTRSMEVPVGAEFSVIVSNEFVVE